MFSFVTKIVNSQWYFDLMYKHTSQHKTDVANTKSEVLRKRKELIGK